MDNKKTSDLNMNFLGLYHVETKMFLFAQNGICTSNGLYLILQVKKLSILSFSLTNNKH